MGPFPLVVECAALFWHGRFLVEECFEYLSEVVQTQRLLPCLVECGDTGQFQRQGVEGFAGVGAWS